MHRSSSLGSVSSSGVSENTDGEASQCFENLGLPENILKRFQYERKISNLYGFI